MYLFDDGFTQFDYYSNLMIKEYLNNCKKYEDRDISEFIFDNSCSLVGRVQDLPFYEYKYMKK